MAVTALQVRSFGGPAFSAVAEADVQKWLDYVVALLDSSTWDTCLDDATTFYTLHLVQQFVLSGGAGGAAGALSGVRVGSVSVSYSSGSGSASSAAQSLGTTAWGRQFLLLRDTLGLTPFLI